jgi:hypothetical protein
MLDYLIIGADVLGLAACLYVAWCSFSTTPLPPRGKQKDRAFCDGPVYDGLIFRVPFNGYYN